jgi:hypothetical protein
MIARWQDTAALRNLNLAFVRYGSKAEILDLSIGCPLYPRKRTLSDTTGMSALCQKRTNALQQNGGL